MQVLFREPGTEDAFPGRNGTGGKRFATTAFAPSSSTGVDNAIEACSRAHEIMSVTRMIAAVKKPLWLSIDGHGCQSKVVDVPEGLILIPPMQYPRAVGPAALALVFAP